MNDSLDRSFGVVIAFLLPGFISVLGIMALSPTVASLLSSSSALSPTIGGVSYVVLCSLGTGLIASAVRGQEARHRPSPEGTVSFKIKNYVCTRETPGTEFGTESLLSGAKTDKIRT